MTIKFLVRKSTRSGDIKVNKIFRLYINLLIRDVPPAFLPCNGTTLLTPCSSLIKPQILKQFVTVFCTKVFPYIMYHFHNIEYRIITWFISIIYEIQNCSYYFLPMYCFKIVYYSLV